MRLIFIFIGILLSSICFGQMEYDFSYPKNYKYGEQYFEDGVAHIYDFVEDDSTTVFLLFVCVASKKSDVLLSDIIENEFGYVKTKNTKRLDLGVEGDIFGIKLGEKENLNGIVYTPKNSQDDILLLFMFLDDNKKEYRLSEITSLLSTFEVTE